MSDSSAAPSIKSSANVTSSRNIYLYRFSSSHLRSKLTSPRLSPGRTWIKAARSKSPGFMAAIAWRISVVFPVLLSPYRIKTFPNESWYRYFSRSRYPSLRRYSATGFTNRSSAFPMLTVVLNSWTAFAVFLAGVSFGSSAFAVFSCCCSSLRLSIRRCNCSAV